MTAAKISSQMPNRLPAGKTLTLRWAAKLGWEPVAPRGMGWGIALSLLPAVILFLVFYVATLGVLVVTALADWSAYGFSWVGVDNFRALFHDPTFWKAAKNTLVYCAAGVFIQVPLGILAAVLLAQRHRGWKFFRALLFIPTVISGAAFALTFTMFYNPSYGLLNAALGWVGLNRAHNWLFDLDTALPAVIATYVFVIGFVVVLVMGEIVSIPGDLYEAAQVDGATAFQQARYITLPLLRHVIGTVILLTLLGTIKLFDVVYIMTAGGPGDRTATLGTYTFNAYLNDRWGYANAVGVVTLAIGLLIIIGVRRAFRIGERDH